MEHKTKVIRLTALHVSVACRVARVGGQALELKTFLRRPCEGEEIATNRDLAGEVRAGRFREDLFHRLNVIALMTPPLRDRKEDIGELAEYFLGRSSARCGRKVSGISPEAKHCLTAYSWPGNVRELENAIERAVVLGDAETLQPEDLPETILETPALLTELAGGYQATVGDAKREAILQAWSEARGDYKLAAHALGLHPNSLLRLIRNLGMRTDLERTQH